MKHKELIISFVMILNRNKPFGLHDLYTILLEGHSWYQAMTEGFY